MTATNSSEQYAFDADAKAVQQINFTVNIDWAVKTTVFFINEEAKETVLNFSQRTIKVSLFCFNIKLLNIIL